MNEGEQTVSSSSFATTTSLVSRRSFLKRLLGSASGLGVGLPAFLASSCSASSQTSTSSSSATSTTASSESATTDTSVVRLSSVVTPKDGGLYDDLLPDFEQQSGYQLQLTTGEDVYGPARNGEADLVLFHYGYEEVQAFVQDSYGRWPQPVFFNQLALLGPPSDPAQVKDLSDLVEAFRRIADTHSPYIVNDLKLLKYLTEIVWEGAARPQKGQWYRDQGLEGQDAVREAAKQGGYILWGLTPFLRTQQQTRVELEPLMLNDALLRRIMVTVAVNPDEVAGVNEQGAKAFQQYLLDPAMQARIRAFRLPGIDQQIWWPAGRDNASAVVPES